MVKRMFEQDFSEGFAGLQGLSIEDWRFLTIAEEGVCHLEDGNYELPLPLKNPSVKLPDNRELAVCRLSQLKRRFMTNEQYRRDYVEFMENVIKRGYARRVLQKVSTDKNAQNDQEQEFDSSAPHFKVHQVWYKPHNGVYHPKKPNKICVLFDCAAEFRGESLNKNLLQGPDLTNTLSGVLCRSRQEPVGLMCDIEYTFYQVSMKEEHRDLFRFLWWEDGNITRDPVEYMMAVHLFGATSSPGWPNFALKRTAQDHKKEFGTVVADFLRREFYVDDGLKSCPTSRRPTT